MKKVYVVLLFCMGLLLNSCEESDNNNNSNTNSGELPDTDDSGTDVEEDDELPGVSGITGYNQPAADVTDWELIFEDEFDAGLSNWIIWEGGAFNEELQHYQEDNLIIENGYLYIKGKRESAVGDTNPFDTTQKAFNFTSGRVESQVSYSAGNTENATKLRFSARILLPNGEGLWPAFWSYGDPWPTQGEIDIMEFRGNDSSSYVTNFFFGNTANTPITDSSQTSYDVPVDSNLTENWHVFELIWSEETFEILLDNVTVHTFTEVQWGLIDDIYTKSERIVLNMAIGGAFFNGQNLVASSIPDLSYTTIDWVRVYKQ